MKTPGTTADVWAPIPWDDGPKIVKLSDGHYAVCWTMFIEAGGSDEAESRSMQLRSWLINRERWPTPEPDYGWHLHDHDGC